MFLRDSAQGTATDSSTRNSEQHLTREHAYLVLLSEVERGLSDVASGHTRRAREALADLKRAAVRRSQESQAAMLSKPPSP